MKGKKKFGKTAGAGPTKKGRRPARGDGKSPRGPAAKAAVKASGGRGAVKARTAKKAERDPAVSGKTRRRGEALTGRVQGSGKGYAFFIPDDGSGDLFIPAPALFGAVHGDVVEAEVTGRRRGNGECRVTKIVRRTFREVAGVYDGRTVTAYERGFGRLRVNRGGAAAFPGDVVTAVLDPTDTTRCTIKEVLGREGELNADIMGEIRSYGLREEFPRAALREASALPDSVDGGEYLGHGRKDFRGETTVTIDGAHSKDFDDAICVTRRPGGGMRLGVYIADVAEYVREGSALDAEAMERGTSVYFADRVLPMLPEKLSNGICSLNEGADRLTLCCIMDFSADGVRENYIITEGVIRSKARLTYEQAEAMIEGDVAVRSAFPAEVSEMLDGAAELARLLQRRRAERGSMEFDLGECEITVENGKVTNVEKRKRLFSHMLIEEFMLAANEAVAERFRKEGVPFVFRVHEAPPAEKTETLNRFLSTFGLYLPDDPSPSDYRKLLASAEDGAKGVVHRMTLRSMSKADYRPQCLGHFGLAAEYYCHFTSPIRRYPDLAIHRIIKYVLHNGVDPKGKFGGFVEEASRQSSERERMADEAERAVDDILKAAYMKDKIGMEYDATVSGVTEWGVFSELDCGVEGLTRTEDLPGDGYEFDGDKMILSGKIQSFWLGKKVRVRVENTERDRVIFSVLD